VEEGGEKERQGQQHEGRRRGGSHFRSACGFSVLPGHPCAAEKGREKKEKIKAATIASAKTQIKLESPVSHLSRDRKRGGEKEERGKKRDTHKTTLRRKRRRAEFAFFTACAQRAVRGKKKGEKGV